MQLQKKTLLALGTSLVLATVACVTDGDQPYGSYAAPGAPVAYDAAAAQAYGQGMAEQQALAAWMAAATQQALQAQAMQGYAQGYAPSYGANYGGGWNGGSPADAWDGGSFYGNSNLGTAVSSSGGSGYIALGGGDFVSW